MTEENSAQKLRFDFRAKNEKLVICVLAVGLTLLVFAIFNLQQRYSKRIKHLAQRLAVISDSKSMLQEALKKTVRNRRGYKNALNNERERAMALDNQLAQAYAEMAKQKDALEQLNSYSDSVKKQNIKLQDNIVKLQQEKEVLNEQVSYFQRLHGNLQRKIKRLLMRTKIELGEVVVKPASLEGRILKANRKYNFIIIDLGKNDGIQMDTTLVALRDGKQIGDITIEKVYDELSVGKAVFEWAGDELAIGDAVRGKE